LPLDVLNICSKADIMASDICGASSAETFLSTLCTKPFHQTYAMASLYKSEKNVHTK